MSNLSNIPALHAASPTQAEGLMSLRARLRSARRPVVVAGAGLAEPSGVQLLRNPAGPERVAESEGPYTPERAAQLWAFWESYRLQAGRARPNATHAALEEWSTFLASQGDGGALSVITTSPDGIAARVLSAGVEVVELHGSAHRVVCTRNPVHAPSVSEVAAPAPGESAMCPVCSSLLRHDVVLAGDAPSKAARRAAERVMRGADLVVFVGTSGRSASTMTLMTAAAALEVECLLFNDRPWEHAVSFAGGAQGYLEDTLPATFPHIDE